MDIRFAAPLLAAALVLLSGCERPDTLQEAVAPDAETLVVINGMPITRADVFAYTGLEGSPEPEPSEGVLEELINLELLRQEAIAQGIDQDMEIQMILRNMEISLLASEVIERRAREMTFSESEIQAEYDAQVAALSAIEYRARHILVDEEAKARELIASLADGAGFADLAAEHSLDASAQEGGDLGWFPPGQMIPAFTEAVEALEPGEYTREPVQSRFGWHVILLEDTRETAPPPLAEVRPQIEEILQARALRAFMEELRADAEIDFPIRPEQ
ncbi:peptidylprolyl isomerase [Thioalkalivibrio sp.]|uniref:peptidylprolyl isomerase n=1 Tax=Thioalkalivibrio sp. TaxID=2093813 RepID=UPI00397573ED